MNECNPSANVSSHPRLWWQVLVVLAVGTLVYLPFLGTKPLDNSEGHRVVPGWAMLRSGDLWRMEMFETGYLRKPPGMSWAVAASSSVLGESVFAARLPSALAAMALGVLTFVFVRRWLGGGGVWGMWAGLACVLMPQLWAPGRSAEIEMLNQLGTGMLALGLLDLVLRREGVGVRLGMAVAAVGIVIAAAAKGPASATVLLGTLGVVAVGAARRGDRAWGAAVLSVALGVAALVPLAIAIHHANSGPGVVRQDVAADFLWSRERLLGVVLLLPMAWLSTAPIGLAMGFPLFTKARRVLAADADALRVAVVCSLAWLASVVLLVLAGVSNPRYALPAAVLVPPVVGAMLKHRSRESLDRPWIMVIGAMLLTMAIGNLWLSARPTPDQLAGPAAARVLVLGIGGGATATVWADHAIEARPDVLDLFAKDAATDGRRVRVVWAKDRMARAQLPESTRGDAYLLLRTDAGSDEGLRYRTEIDRKGLVVVSTARIRGYEFTLFKRVLTPS